MKNRYWVALGAVAACGFAAPALTQDTNVAHGNAPATNLSANAIGLRSQISF